MQKSLFDCYVKRRSMYSSVFIAGDKKWKGWSNNASVMWLLPHGGLISWIYEWLTEKTSGFVPTPYLLSS